MGNMNKCLKKTVANRWLNPNPKSVNPVFGKISYHQKLFGFFSLIHASRQMFPWFGKWSCQKFYFSYMEMWSRRRMFEGWLGSPASSHTVSWMVEKLCPRAKVPRCQSENPVPLHCINFSLLTILSSRYHIHFIDKYLRVQRTQNN